MRKEALAYYGGALDESRSEVRLEALRSSGAELSRAKVDRILESRYFDFHYVIDFGNLQKSIDGMSETFKKRFHDVSYRDWLAVSAVLEEYSAADLESKEAENPETVYYKMVRTFHLHPSQVSLERRANKITIVGLFANEADNVKTMKQFMDDLGYFPALEKGYAGADGRKWTAVSFEPYVPYEFSLYEGDHAYHLSPRENKESVLKFGLLPYSKNNLFDYPPRVYAFKAGTDYGKMCATLRLMARQSKTASYDLVRIDTASLGEKFFMDPNCEEGIYTYHPVPPEYVKWLGPLPELDRNN